MILCKTNFFIDILFSGNLPLVIEFMKRGARLNSLKDLEEGERRSRMKESDKKN